MRFHDLPQRTSQIAAQNEQDAESQTDQNADQQIGEHDRQNRHDKRKKLVGALTPHLPEQLRLGQLESRDDQHGSQAGKGI